MDYKQFASSIKSKYPQYADMDDTELAQKMVAKFPEYSDVTFGNQPEQNQYNKNGIAGALIPRSIQANEKDTGVVGKVLSAAGDVLSLPQRALSAGATAAGTLAGGGSISQAAKEGVEDLSNFKSKEDGALGFAQNMAYDPTLLVPGLGMVGAGKKILQGGKIGARLGKSLLAGAAQGGTSAALQTANGDNPDYGSIAATAGLGAAIPLAGSGIAKVLPKALGGGIENAGKMFKGGELKIPKNVAKKAYGTDLVEQKQNIINDMADFGITKGNTESMLADASAKASERFQKADEIAKQIASSFNSPKVNGISEATKSLNIEALANIDEEGAAQDYVNSIVNKWSEKGYNQDSPINALIEMKQSLNKRGDLFSHGVGKSDSDLLKQAIKKKMYLNLVDAIGEISPEIKTMNTEGKRLLDVHAALDAASSRTANHNAVGLTDWVLGGASVAHPGALATTVPLFITKKALGNNRGSNALINIGRKLQGKETNTIEGSLSKLNELPATSGAVPSTSLPPQTNLDIPTYQRNGIDVAGMQASDDAARIAERAKSLRITPEQYAKIEQQIKDDQALADASKRAQIEQDVTLENLPKSPVITMDRLRAMANQGKSRVTPNKVIGDVSSWHILSDNYPIPRRPVTLLGLKHKGVTK